MPSLPGTAKQSPKTARCKTGKQRSHGRLCSAGILPLFPRPHAPERNWGLFEIEQIAGPYDGIPAQLLIF